jgi:hypothetical protein
MRSAFSATGSWPRAILASSFFAAARASLALSSLVEPSVMRRCLAPSEYWMIQRFAPPSRRRSPKPGKSSSKRIASFLPAGSAVRSVLACVSFNGDPVSGRWEGYGKITLAYSCAFKTRGMGRFFRIYKVFLIFPPLLHSPKYGYPNSFNHGVPGSSPGGLTTWCKRSRDFFGALTG